MATNTSMDNKVTDDFWKNKWQKGEIGFHKTDVHPHLQKHIHHLLNERQNIKFFFPMCGKDISMKWLYDQGHSVVGVEFVEQAILEFFQEQGLPFKSEEKGPFKVFTTEDNRIRVYCGDLFKFSRSFEGQFDGIWDRGSLEAINTDQRLVYRDMILSLLHRDARCLLATADYDKTRYGGPPHCVTPEELALLYGEACSIQEIDYESVFEPRHRIWNLEALHVRISLLHLK